MLVIGIDSHFLKLIVAGNRYRSQLSDFAPLNAGYTVSVRRTRLNVLVLLTLAIAESHRPASFTRAYTPGWGIAYRYLLTRSIGV